MAFLWMPKIPLGNIWNTQRNVQVPPLGSRGSYRCLFGSSFLSFFFFFLSSPCQNVTKHDTRGTKHSCHGSWPGSRFEWRGWSGGLRRRSRKREKRGRSIQFCIHLLGFLSPLLVLQPSSGLSSLRGGREGLAERMLQVFHWTQAFHQEVRLNGIKWFGKRLLTIDGSHQQVATLVDFTACWS